MQNLELYQHESDPTRNDYQNNSPYDLERLLRRLIQEETKRITQTTNPYNNRWDRNNNRNQYNNNGNRNNQYRHNNPYQSHGNNRGNDNQYQNNNPYQPYGNNRGNDNQQNRRFGESRPGESRFRNNENNEPAYRKTNPTRPNSPSATLAVMEEKDTVYEEMPFDFNLINQEFEDEYIYDNEEDYNTNEYYDIRDDNDYYDDDLQIHEENFDELYAVQQRAPLPRTRQLRPRNETGKVNKINSQKKVDFVDPPVRRKSRKQKQATQLQDNHMNSQTYQERNGAASTLQNVEPTTIPNIENLPLPPPPLPTTGLASTFGESSLNKAQNITGNQWTEIRNNNDMDIDSPPNEKETKKFNKKFSQPPLNSFDKTKNVTFTKPKQSGAVTQKDNKTAIQKNTKKMTDITKSIIRKEPYNVSTDILNRTADISFGQLLRLAPSLRRQFSSTYDQASDLSEEESSEGSETESLSDDSSTDSDITSPILEEMLANEYWFEDELYPMIETSHPLELDLHEDILQICQYIYIRINGITSKFY
ncbi:hypothetical protein INT45_013822 [Circinella minor]|uniref:Uncharacterized protein n=1 Tax=Circinella minor TaxID=1195481 RepID=A0A8H7RUB1_9FUNG|nr:hypothetical protein INT45_013822 [Circinella minor]